MSNASLQGIGSKSKQAFDGLPKWSRVAIWAISQVITGMGWQNWLVLYTVISWPDLSAYGFHYPQAWFTGAFWSAAGSNVLDYAFAWIVYTLITFKLESAHMDWWIKVFYYLNLKSKAKKTKILSTTDARLMEIIEDDCFSPTGLAYKLVLGGLVTIADIYFSGYIKIGKAPTFLAKFIVFIGVFITVVSGEFLLEAETPTIDDTDDAKGSEATESKGGA